MKKVPLVLLLSAFIIVPLRVSAMFEGRRESDNNERSGPKEGSGISDRQDADLGFRPTYDFCPSDVESTSDSLGENPVGNNTQSENNANLSEKTPTKTETKNHMNGLQNPGITDEPQYSPYQESGHRETASPENNSSMRVIESDVPQHRSLGAAVAEEREEQEERFPQERHEIRQIDRDGVAAENHAIPHDLLTAYQNANNPHVREIFSQEIAERLLAGRTFETTQQAEDYVREELEKISASQGMRATRHEVDNNPENAYAYRDKAYAIDNELDLGERLKPEHPEERLLDFTRAIKARNLLKLAEKALKIGDEEAAKEYDKAARKMLVAAGLKDTQQIQEYEEKVKKLERKAAGLGQLRLRADAALTTHLTLHPSHYEEFLRSQLRSQENNIYAQRYYKDAYEKIQEGNLESAQLLGKAAAFYDQVEALSKNDLDEEAILKQADILIGKHSKGAAELYELADCYLHNPHFNENPRHQNVARAYYKAAEAREAQAKALREGDQEEADYWKKIVTILAEPFGAAWLYSDFHYNRRRGDEQAAKLSLEGAEAREAQAKALLEGDQEGADYWEKIATILAGPSGARGLYMVADDFNRQAGRVSEGVVQVCIKAAEAREAQAKALREGNQEEIDYWEKIATILVGPSGALELYRFANAFRVARPGHEQAIQACLKAAEARKAQAKALEDNEKEDADCYEQIAMALGIGTPENPGAVGLYLRAAIHDRRLTEEERNIHDRRLTEEERNALVTAAEAKEAQAEELNAQIKNSFILK